MTAIVTAEPLDPEMAERILAHKSQRPPDWKVIEAPIHLADAVASVHPAHLLVLDSITMWLHNRLLTGESPEMIEKSARAVSIGLAARSGPTVVVSDEIGMGVVPDRVQGRRLRDLQGRVNRMLVDEFARSFLVVAGRLVPLDDAGWREAQRTLIPPGP